MADGPTFRAPETAEDHDGANKERVEDFAAAGHLTRDYSEGYLHGLQDAADSRARLESRRRAGRRRALRLAIAGGVAWLVGAAVGDTIGALARWAEES